MANSIRIYWWSRRGIPGCSCRLKFQTNVQIIKLILLKNLDNSYYITAYYKIRNWWIIINEPWAIDTFILPICQSHNFVTHISIDHCAIQLKLGSVKFSEILKPFANNIQIRFIWKVGKYRKKAWNLWNFLTWNSL